MIYVALTYALFPMLTEELAARIRYQGADFDFSYSEGYDDQPLQADIMEGGGSLSTYSLIDPRGRWTPELFDWKFSRAIRLMTPSFLFGPKGIAPRNATLGLAIKWISSTSKQRGTIKIGTFASSYGDKLQFEASGGFKPMQLRGRVELTTVLYIAEPAKNVSKEESHLANAPGTVLGELEKVCIVLDGEGSMFPIVEVSEPVQPLWYVHCDWNNPLEDSFAENVRLSLNRAHKSYAHLDQNSPQYDDRLMREIMASALTIIITKLKQDGAYWNDIENGQNLEHGSVGEAVYYFVNTLGWQTATPEALSVSIRKYLDKVM